jgi:hypothetical protein
MSGASLTAAAGDGHKQAAPELDPIQRQGFESSRQPEERLRHWDLSVAASSDQQVVHESVESVRLRSTRQISRAG